MRGGLFVRVSSGTLPPLFNAKVEGFLCTFPEPQALNRFSASPSTALNSNGSGPVVLMNAHRGFGCACLPRRSSLLRQKTPRSFNRHRRSHGARLATERRCLCCCTRGHYQKSTLCRTATWSVNALALFDRDGWAGHWLTPRVSSRDMWAVRAQEGKAWKLCV